MYSYEIRLREPNPAKAVLLVIDMQNYFAPTAVPIIPTVRSTVDICRSAGIPIIFVHHVDRPPTTPTPGKPAHLHHNMLREWWGKANNSEGSSNTELLQDIGFDAEKDTLVKKHTYGAFHGTELEEILEKLGVEEVVITGVNTNVCCETTAREAFARGFRVFFSADATGTATVELHEGALKSLAFAFAYLVDCNRLSAAFAPRV